MGLLDDILKGLPVNPLLREKIAELEAKYAATETENAILKDDLRDAKTENQKLKNQIEELTHTDTTDLDETELGLLQAISNMGDNSYEGVIASRSQLPRQRLQYYLEKLEGADYLHVGILDRRYGSLYRLTQKARELLIKRGLL